jgi:enoyl-CoA hydratase/carnithine racemase
MSQSLIVSLENNLLTLTLNRPAKKNAITHEMYGALVAELRAAENNPAVRVVVLQGAGGNFTAGNDLFDFFRLNLMDMDETIWQTLPVVQFLRQVVTFAKPLVCAVEGVAVGIGTTLLLHCDVVVSSTSARFSLPFVRLGLVPEFGSSLLLPMLGGPLQARQKLLLGEPFDAKEAQALGFVSVICEQDGTVLETAKAYAQKLANLPARAVRTSKQLINAHFREELLTALSNEEREFLLALRSAEFQEAAFAFIEKREANFRQFE